MQQEIKLFLTLFSIGIIARICKIKKDNKGIRLIKQYVFKIYKLMKETLKETSSEDKQDA